MTTTSPARVRVAPGLYVTFVLFIVGMVLRTVFSLWHPSLAMLDYENLSPIREQWWAMHIFVGAPGALLAFASFPVLAYALCRARGSVVAAVGGAVTVTGIIFFGQGIAAEGVTYGYVLNTAALSGEQGEKLLTYITDHAELSQIGIFGGLAVTSLGVLVLLAALWLARAVPRWLLVLPVIGLVGGLALPFAPFSLELGLFDIVTQDVPLVLIAVLALRTAKHATD
ncbi:hypothetical protein GCM10009555_101420 [Acrocarpospora macrocephala]|uniref:DUF4386 domain-containing protein n=1 Tax=Acrocarpospora macrocephala TaxID=150177 RepID=A0A5M3WE07_9ACTN|nr:hypothetical protein [Acrocarpospora macrocephala]GES07066.1 hypothetical protein Amac_006610 [Acrocarpospora macrocephala]